MVAAVSDNPLDNSLDNLIDNPSGNSIDNSLINPAPLDLVEGTGNTSSTSSTSCSYNLGESRADILTKANHAEHILDFWIAGLGVSASIDGLYRQL